MHLRLSTSRSYFWRQCKPLALLRASCSNRQLFYRQTTLLRRSRLDIRIARIAAVFDVQTLGRVVVVHHRAAEAINASGAASVLNRRFRGWRAVKSRAEGCDIYCGGVGISMGGSMGSEIVRATWASTERPLFMVSPQVVGVGIVSGPGRSANLVGHWIANPRGHSGTPTGKP